MKTYSNIVSLWAVSLALLFNGCREQDDMKEALTRTPIQIAADYNTTTRVSDAGFADGLAGIEKSYLGWASSMGSTTGDETSENAE